MVASMSVICIMLFMTISILSASLALKNTMQSELEEMTPVDLNLYKMAYMPETYKKYGKETITTEEQREDSKLPISETLKNNGLDMNKLKDIIEIASYTDDGLTNAKFFGDTFEEVKAQYGRIDYSIPEEIIKISDYNKVAKLYGINQYELKDDEYIVICDFDSMKLIRDRALADSKNNLSIAGKTYKSKYNECKSGYVTMSTSHTNTGIILVPDSCNLKENMKEEYYLIANYNADTDEEKEEIDKIFSSGESGLVQKLNENGLEIDGLTKTSLYEASLGIATIVTFIAIYLGIIFMIASSAILALKQLTESSDNKQRYLVLRKIGCDEKIMNRSLFRQIGIFFILPLIIAIIHSIFGIQFAVSVLSGLATKEALLPSIIGTVVFMGGIYLVYFFATYVGSKNIIKEE